MRMIKAILIDPFAKAVTEVDVDADDYKAIYPLISREDDVVDCFTGVTLPKGDIIMVDDEGLVNWFARNQAFFAFEGLEQPYAGKGLLLGSDQVGETVAPRFTLEQVKAMVSWVSDAQLLEWIER